MLLKGSQGMVGGCHTDLILGAFIFSFVPAYGVVVEVIRAHVPERIGRFQHRFVPCALGTGPDDRVGTGYLYELGLFHKGLPQGRVYEMVLRIDSNANCSKNERQTQPA